MGSSIKANRKKAVKIFLIIVFIGFLYFIIFSNKSEPPRIFYAFQERFASVFKPSSSNEMQYNNYLFRLHAIGEILNELVIKKVSFLIGEGYGESSITANSYYTISHVIWHNAYANVLLRTGIMGLCFFLFFYFKVTTSLYNIFRTPHTKILKAISQTVLAFIIFNLVVRFGSTMDLFGGQYGSIILALGLAFLIRRIYYEGRKVLI